MGRSEMELKIWAMGRPSSFSIISNACKFSSGHLIQQIHSQLNSMTPQSKQHDLGLIPWTQPPQSSRDPHACATASAACEGLNAGSDKPPSRYDT